jgi:hypothetical protein
MENFYRREGMDDFHSLFIDSHKCAHDVLPEMPECMDALIDAEADSESLRSLSTSLSTSASEQSVQTLFHEECMSTMNQGAQNRDDGLGPRLLAEGSDRLPRGNPYVGTFHRGTPRAEEAAQPEMAGCMLPRHNPYVGSFHRGAVMPLKRKAGELSDGFEEVKMKKSPSSDGLRRSTEHFVQQFLPLGMMSAAVAGSRTSRKGVNKGKDAQKK